MKFLFSLMRRIVRFFWRLFVSLAVATLTFAIIILAWAKWNNVDLNTFLANQQLSQNLENLTNLSTDFIQNVGEGDATWPTNQVTVYIDTDNETYRQAYEQAMANWNATGCFTFYLIDSKEGADIIATSMNDSSTEAAGQANTLTNPVTQQITQSTVYLNDAYLMNPDYGYDLDRIIHTAEHELGHAIGLAHNDAETSVMESSGSYTGIQDTDVQAVLYLYPVQ